MFETLEDRRLLAVLYRVNAGGPEVTSAPAWTADTAVAPSPYSNANTGGNSATWSGNVTVNLSHSSLPSGTPMALFQTHRYDKPGPPNLIWNFPVTPGTYDVRLFFAETWSGGFARGVRVFDVIIEGSVVLNDYDIFADVGSKKGVMKSFTVTSDSVLNLEFGRVKQNPMVQAIEIVSTGQPSGALTASTTSLDFGTVLIGQQATRTVTLTNTGSANVVIDPAEVQINPSETPFTFAFAQNTPFTLAAGQSIQAAVHFAPATAVSAQATLSIPHDGAGSPTTISLSGLGATHIPISFSKSPLGNTTGLNRPTSLQFGPDGRLYVSQQNGLLRAYTIERQAENDYRVVAAETINVIQQIPNHNDDGTLNPAITQRLVTGLLVVGTAAQPVIYVGSSDPRIGGGNSGTDLNLDTNSSIISRLTWTGSSWSKLDLVRGLPRSEENHAVNGMQLDANTNTLYVTAGGNTNMGAPSNNFAYLPEYAYSAAILAIDLNAIGETTYDLPTLDDETRPGVNDFNDPFGGNDGRNQAKIVPGSPVQVFAPGFRNAYDLVITSQGRMYTVDNGPNAGWGGIPIGEGPGGNATNQPSEPGVSYGDGLHFVTHAGYYGGHPNPTRSNPANTFNSTNPQSPVTVANPIESDYLIPGVENGALIVYPNSTNGIVEYTSAAFGGAMTGDLLIASFDNSIKRVKLNAAGDQVLLAENLFSNVGSIPLDVTSPGTGPFAGSIWVADLVLGTIYVFEPSGGSGGTPDDWDGDCYSNDDELANGTDPHNPADVPHDWDLDCLSNLMDPDDDNDGLSDEEDPFAIDFHNGNTTPVGVFYDWENDGESPGGILGMGFTGLMTNGTTNYEALYDPSAVTAGGAAGVFTIDRAGQGTARGAINTQDQAFQFGVHVAAETTLFVARTRVLGAFNGLTPQPGQEMGFYIGLGDQDNYLQLVVSGDQGGSIQALLEVGGNVALGGIALVPLPGQTAIDLQIVVDPSTAMAQPRYSFDGSDFHDLGPAIAIPAAWLTDAIAVGLIATNPVATNLPVTWDYLGLTRMVGPGDAAARLEIYPGGSIHNSSTARIDSFRIYNDSTAGKRISSVTIDLETSFLPDMVFDPYGLAGDVVGIPFTPNSGAAATGLATHAFSGLKDDGYTRLRVDFNDFDPGEVFTFRVDVDPTSVRGSAQPGPANAADVSGLELAGSIITVQFSDGTSLTGQTFALPQGAPFYKVHSDVRLASPPVSMAPEITVVGIGQEPAIVQNASQVVRVLGTPGAMVRLLHSEVALHLAGVPGGGYNVEPFEGNKVIFVQDKQGVIGPSGFLDITVTLKKSIAAGGLNYFAAVVDLPDGRTSNMSNVIKLALGSMPSAPLTVPCLPDGAGHGSSYATYGFALTACDLEMQSPLGPSLNGSLGILGNGTSSVPNSTHVDRFHESAGPLNLQRFPEEALVSPARTLSGFVRQHPSTPLRVARGEWRAGFSSPMAGYIQYQRFIDAVMGQQHIDDLLADLIDVPE